MRCPEFIRFMRRCGFELVRVGGYSPTSRLWESTSLRSRARDAE